MLEALAAVLAGDRYAIPQTPMYPRGSGYREYRERSGVLRDPRVINNRSSELFNNNYSYRRFGELSNTTPGTNHNNNNPKNPGHYFNKLEEENFYLRTQLQSLLQELRAKEELEQEQEGFSLPGASNPAISDRGTQTTSVGPCTVPSASYTRDTDQPKPWILEDRQLAHLRTNEERSLRPTGSEIRSSSLESSFRRQLASGSSQSNYSSVAEIGDFTQLTSSPIRRRIVGESLGGTANFGPVSSLGSYLPKNTEPGGEDFRSSPISRRHSVKERLQTLEAELAQTAAHQRSLELERQIAISDMLASSAGQANTSMIPSTSGRGPSDTDLPPSSFSGSPSQRNHNSQRKVSSLESKVEALERKYELQAVKHRQLTNELVRLRRQSSTGELDPLGSVSIEVQTSPEEGSAQWPLPTADAVHGSPQRSPAFRRAASDSPKRGAHIYPLAQDPIQASSSRSGFSSGGGGYLDSPPPTSSGIRLQRHQRTSLPSSSVHLPTGTASTARTTSTTSQQLLIRQGCTVESFGPKGQVSRADLIDWLSDHPNGRLFRAKFGYLPIRDSPNDRPELELTLDPGDYVLIEGDLDEDLFYEGQKLNKEKGLVPSNYVERVPDHELYISGEPSTSRSPPQPLQLTTAKVQESIRIGNSPRFSNPPIQLVHSSAAAGVGPRLPNPVVQFPPPPPPVGMSAPRLGVLHQPIMSSGKQYSLQPRNPATEYVLVNHDPGNSPSTPLPESVCPYPAVDVSRVSVHEVRQTEGARVPCPRDLLIERQLAKSVVISWSPPESSLTSAVTQYHICVDGTVKAVVPGGYKTKALVEDLDHCFPHRISVRAVTETGHSPDASCTVTVGTDVSVAPEDVKVNHVTPVSGQVSWHPSNSNCEHLILLNGLKVGACPPGVHQVLLKGLIPSTMYRCAIRAKYPRAVLEEKPVESFVDFKTLPKIGLPDPPANVQCEPGPQDWTLLITWTPVTNQPKPPSRAAVAGYMIYADGKKITDVNVPTGDHVLLRMTDFMDDPPLFITVRTRTKEGAVSSDSNVVRVPRSLHGAAAVLTPKKRFPQTSPLAQASIHAAADRLLETTPSVTTVTTAVPSVPPATALTSGVGGSAGLLMIQPPAVPPHAPPPQQSPFHSATVGAFPQVSPAGGVATGGLAQVIHPPMVTTATPIQPLQQTPYTMYTVPTGAPTMTTAVTYSQPHGGTTTIVPALQAGAPTGQYYVFHPQLTRTQQGGEKPSLLEMENSYLVKHNLMPFNAALAGAGNYATLPHQSVLAAQGRVPYSVGAQAAAYPQVFNGQAPTGSVRSLPAINPATGMPFRTDQYAQAWQTLSPATRRRLEQYINQPFPPSPALLDYDRRREHSMKNRRAAWRKRSYSADEELEAFNHGATLDVYGHPAAVPRIQITGASGSEGAGSIIDFGDEPWDFTSSYPSKPSARFRRRYYQQANSRARSEPDLRIDERFMALNRSRFVMALYDYEPRHMSPNPNAAQEELSFRKGQVIKIFGSRDMDGFYRGELNGRRGLVPSNMVAAVDKEMGYRMHDLRLGASSELPYPQRMPPPEYEPYYPQRSAVTPGRRRSDNFPMNSSDPNLNARYLAGGGNYSDYDSSASADRYTGRAEDPRLRRMRFQQMKSRSLDHYRKDEYGRPQYRGRHPVAPEEFERRYPPVGTERDRDMYRGSLDRRDRRDYSLPVRSPSQQEVLDRRTGRPVDPRYERDRPTFGLEDAEGYYGRRPMQQDRRYPEEYDPRRVGPPPPPGGPQDGRYYDERRRYEAERGRPDPYRYPEDHRKMEDERYHSERDLEIKRRGDYPPPNSDPSRYYPERERGRVPEEFNGRYPNAPQGVPPGYQAPSGGGAPSRDLYEQFYEQGGAPGRRKARPSGRDNIEQSMREAAREPPRKMVARFDYDPRESSPNVDAENVELTFKTGDMIMVFGGVDEDGFFVGELNGKRGLVPSNFLEPYSSAVAAMSQQQVVHEDEAAVAARSRKEGVTFSDSVLEEAERAAYAAQAQPRSAQPAGPSGAIPARAVGPSAGAGGGARAAGPKPGTAAKPPGVMKKADSTVGPKSVAKKSDPGAKGSPASSRKVSQAAGAKKPSDTGVKRK